MGIHIKEGETIHEMIDRHIDESDEEVIEIFNKLIGVWCTNPHCCGVGQSVDKEYVGDICMACDGRYGYGKTYPYGLKKEEYENDKFMTAEYIPDILKDEITENEWAKICERFNKLDDITYFDSDDEFDKELDNLFYLR